MKKIFTFTLFLLSITTIFAANDDIVFTIGGKDISSEEFLRIYNKNNNLPNSYDKKSVDEYVDLFINYKLKVIEAEAKGYDTIPEFIKEFKGYRDQLAEPYLKNTKYDEQLVKEAYEHYKEERRASHILIKCEADASPSDTLKAWKRINELKKRVDAGEPFGEVAEEASECPSGKKAKGDLGWFNVFRMVYPFEATTYNTPLNEVSDILRTRFGYHLIKTTGVRDNRGEVHVKHIFVTVNPNPDDLEKSAAKKKIYEAYNKLKDGADWATIVKEYSEHDPTLSTEGDFGWQSSSTVFDEYLQVCFDTPLGEISEPFLSNFGYHLVKPLEIRPIASYEAKKADYASKIKRDKERIEKMKKLSNLELEEKYRVVKHADKLEELFPLLDSTIYTKTWKASKAKDLNAVVLSIGENNYTLANFAAYLSDKKATKNKYTPKQWAETLFPGYCTTQLKEYQKEQLKEEHPDYANLLQEYYDGILLFNISNDEVWEKATKDSTGLEKFYNTMDEKYMWEQRLDISIYQFSDSALIEPILTAAKKKAKKGLNVKEMNSLVCPNDSLGCLRITDKIVERNNNAWADSLEWKKGAHIETPFKNKLRLYYVNKVLKPQEKTLADARGLYIADYQNYLEKEWIKSLRKKHEIIIHETVLNKIKKQVEQE